MPLITFFTFFHFQFRFSFSFFVFHFPTLLHFIIPKLTSGILPPSPPLSLPLSFLPSFLHHGRVTIRISPCTVVCALFDFEKGIGWEYKYRLLTHTHTCIHAHMRSLLPFPFLYRTEHNVYHGKQSSEHGAWDVKCTIPINYATSIFYAVLACI